jgi:hypothetical protein
MTERRFWTETGVDCYLSRADCDNCHVFLQLGYSHNNGCNQVKANQYLLDHHIAIPDKMITDCAPIQEKERKVPEPTGKGLSDIRARGNGTEMERAGYLLKKRIMELIDVAGGQATMKELADLLQWEGFMGREWDARSISNHLYAMVEKMVLSGPQTLRAHEPYRIVRRHIFDETFRNPGHNVKHVWRKYAKRDTSLRIHDMERDNDTRPVYC